MGTIQAGLGVLRGAESDLREMIQKALVEQRYGDVKQLADLADGVAKLLLRNGALSIPTVTSVAEPSSASMPLELKASPGAHSRQSRPPVTRVRYPRFDRDDDRLVKVGWSKKSKKEYEHRVPKEIVLSFVRHLGQTTPAGKVFDVEGLLPVQDVSGNEIPAYQVYVTLAWLREAGVLEKKGRDGYVLREGSVLNGGIEGLWESLPARSA